MVNKKIILFFFTAFSWLYGTDFSVTLEVSDIHYIQGQANPTVFLGDSFELKTIVSGTEQAPNSVTIPGLDSFSIQSKGSQSNVSIYNSSIQATQTTRYTLLTKQIGTFTVGPAKLTQNGKTYTSNTIVIRVAKQNQKEKLKVVKKTSNTKASHEPELFCELTTSKQEAFEGEPIPITLAIYEHGQILGKGVVEPKFSNCTVKQSDNFREYKKNKDGKTFSVYEKQYIIFPKQTGLLTIPPAKTMYKIQDPKRRDRSLFNDPFFSNFHSLIGTKQKVASSKPLSIKIKNLPEYHESVDSIGEFSQFTLSSDKQKAMINEPIKLTVSLTGKGNFDLVLPPNLTLPKEFKIYDSKTETKQDFSHGYTEGIKTFEFILQIPQAGSSTIPPQTFVYFDTKNASYKKLHTKPLSLTITSPEKKIPTPQQQIKKTNKKEKPAQKITDDIHFIEEELLPHQQKQISIPLWLLILLVILTPCSFFFSTIKQYFLRIIPLQKDNLATYQKKLSELFDYNEIEKLHTFFIDFLIETYALSKAKISENLIKKKLLKHLPPETVSSFMMFLDECAQYSFTKEKNILTKEKDLKSKANHWVTLIYKTKNKV